MDFENRQAAEISAYANTIQIAEAQGAKLAASGVNIRVFYTEEPAHTIAVLEAAVAVAQAQTPALKMKRRLVLANAIYAGAKVVAAEKCPKVRLTRQQGQKLNERDPKVSQPTSEFVAFLSTSLEQKQEVPKIRLTRQQQRQQQE